MNTVMKTKYALLAAAMLLILFSGCEDKDKSSSQDQAPVAVTLAMPTVPGGEGFFSASGQLEAEQYARISTRLMGYVSTVNVKVGDRVARGQLLLSINNDEIEAKRAQAEAGFMQAQARLAIAEKDYNRFKALYEQKSSTQKEMDDMTSQYVIAQAQVESARQVKNEIDAMLSYSNIRAPFSGVITSAHVKMGDMANPGQTLLTLEAPGKFIATALVPETEISNVIHGAEVQVFIKSNGTALSGKVNEISTSSQYSGGQYLVKISLEPSNEQKMYSGMFVSTLFPTQGKGSKNIMIPRSALIHWGELEGIYTVSSSNTAILRWLKLGRVYGDQVEVLSGLGKDEAFISSFEGKIYNGANVTIKE